MVFSLLMVQWIVCCARHALWHGFVLSVTSAFECGIKVLGLGTDPMAIDELTSWQSSLNCTMDAGISSANGK
jgi:hypothetical protein